MLIDIMNHLVGRFFLLGTTTCKHTREILCATYSVTRRWIKNCPKSSQSSFDLKINIALKINQIFGLLLYCYLSPRTFKNRPIRSHWGSRIKAKLTIEFSLKMSELQSADAMPVLCYANGFLSFFLSHTPKGSSRVHRSRRRQRRRRWRRLCWTRTSLSSAP